MNQKTVSPTDASHESTFGSQFLEAIQERIGQSKDATQDGKPDDGDATEAGKKKDGQLQLPVIAVILSTVLPAAPLAAVGLPTAGDEPGQSAESAAAPQEAQAALSIETSAPAAAAPKPAQPELKADLAFALKLETTSLNVPAKDSSTQPQAVAEKASGTSFSLSAADNSAAPPLEAKPHLSAQPIKATAAATQQSDTSGPDANSENESPRDQRPSASSREQPSIEAKSTRAPGPAPAAAISAHSESLAPVPGPIVTTTAQSVEPRSQAPANSVSQAPITEHAAAPAEVRTTPASSEVTDVSVTIPIPRTDSAGDDRVAIRMVQRGTEIHVSVRTPDHQLTQSLRQDLGKLSAGLDQAGFRTESWRPAATNAAAQSQSNARHESRRDAPNHDAAPGSDARSGGQNGRGARDQRKRQQNEAPRWVAELEQYRNQ